MKQLLSNLKLIKFNTLKLSFVAFLTIGTIHLLSAQPSTKLKLGKVSEVKAMFETHLEKANERLYKHHIKHELPNQLPLILNVEFSRKQGISEVFYGNVENTINSNFYLKFDANKAEGAIILFDQKKYYSYTTSADGTVHLIEEDIDKVLCVNYQEEAKNERKTQTKTQTAAVSSVPVLESFPGAEAVVYLDFDGQSVSGTFWNQLTNGNPIEAAPSNLTESEIIEIWKIVSEDFMPFNLNITTNENVFNNAPANKRMRVIFTPTDEWYPNAMGGVAYIGSFSWGGTLNGETPCWVWNTSIKTAGDCGSHEIGHTLNLAHDGRMLSTGHEEYYYGQNSWAPIMGSSYDKLFAQWSIGEYVDSNNKEDDLLKITTMNGFGYRADDHGNSIASATPIVFDQDGKVNASVNKGIIATRSDIDFFSFTTTGGTIGFTVKPHPAYPNLDVLLNLHNSSGAIISTSDPGTAEANLDANLEAGTYYLSIDGTKGAMGADSDYGSLGAYTISSKEYCIPTYATNCTSLDLINNFSFNTLVNNNTGCTSSTSLGYTNYAPSGNLTTEVTAGQSYSLKVQSGSLYAQYFGVWIDFNKDGDFDDEGEYIYNSGSVSTDEFSTQVIIPTTASSGKTRLRVRSSYHTALTSDQSCQQITYGEAEDYTITINAPVNEAPNVAITSPANNATFMAPASIIISAIASDTDGTISKVSFYQGTTKLGEDETSPYTYNWAEVGVGTYSLTARATDNEGAETTSATISVTVGEPANQAPIVAITSPSQGQQLTVHHKPIKIKVLANDVDGKVNKVEFYVGSTKIGEDRNAPYTHNWRGVGAGTYSLTARAIDDDGAETVSAEVSVVITDPSGKKEYAVSQNYVVDVIKDITVYPNPVVASSIVNVELPVFFEDISLIIYNLNSGERISSNVYKKANALKVNMLDLPRGVYGFTIIADGEVWVKKVVVY